MTRSSRHAAFVLVALFVVSATGLWLLGRATRPGYRLSPAQAIAAARSDPVDREFLAGHPAGRVRVIPLDDRLQRVTFFDGPRVVLDAGVAGNGQVVASERHLPGVPASGARLANSPWILALLGVLFLLASMVVPLKRLRNLDALVLVSFTSTVLLINARLVAASVICGSLALCYLMLRCLWVGLFAERREQSAPTVALLSWLTSGWETPRRLRLLRLLVFASGLSFLMITLSSSGYTDVATASLSGATDLLHGISPYGHITLAVHGDTYPLLNYLLFLPAAALTPVTSAFSDQSGALVLTALSALLVAGALYRLADRRDSRRRASELERSEASLRMMLAWFAFAPVLLAASGGSNDLVLAALLAWMLAAHSKPALSLLLLCMAAWVKLVPLILLPLWVASRHRVGIRALIPAGALSLALGTLLITLGGFHAISQMLGAVAFQFQRGSFFAPWYTFGLRWLQPLVQAAMLCLLVAVCVRQSRRRHAGHDHLAFAALAGALLLGVQLSANYWTWSYLPWVFPFVALALLRDTATAQPSPAIDAGPSRRAEQPPRRSRVAHPPARRRSVPSA